MHIHTYISNSDQRLLSGCFSGDPAMIETFVRQYSELIYSTIQRVFQTKHIQYINEDLEDLHNTVFLQLFDNRCKKLKQYKGLNGCSLATWINVVTVRIVLNQLRKKGHDALNWQKKRISIEEMSEIIGNNPGPLDLIDEAEKAKLIKQWTESLPYRDRLFLKIYMEADFSLERTAKIMEITPGNAYTIKHRAIKKLKAFVIAKVK